MKLLVTGGAGYIGSAVTRRLLEAGASVTVVDDLSTGHRDAVPDGADLVEASLLDRDALSQIVRDGFDGVLHFAARSIVSESVNEPLGYWRVNVLGTLNLLEAITERRVSRIVFSSTAAVYGDPETLPITESAPTRPTSPYGATKLAADRMIAACAQRYGLATCSLRYFNVAGAIDGDGERHPVETHLIPIALEVAAGLRDRLSIFGSDYATPDGTAVRDYIHLDDLVRAHLLALERARPGQAAIYNLGNGHGYSVREVVDVARKITGREIPVIAEARRPGDPSVLVASNELAAAGLGWEPEKKALEVMIEDAWRPVLARSRGSADAS